MVDEREDVAGKPQPISPQDAQHLANMLRLQEQMCAATPVPDTMYVPQPRSRATQSANGMLMFEVQKISNVDYEREQLEPDGRMSPDQVRVSIQTLERRIVQTLSNTLQTENLGSYFTEEQVAALAIYREDWRATRMMPVPDLQPDGTYAYTSESSQALNARLMNITSEEGRRMLLHSPLKALQQDIQAGQIKPEALLKTLAGKEAAELCESYWVGQVGGTNAALQEAIGSAAANIKPAAKVTSANRVDGYGYMIVRNEKDSNVTLHFTSAETEAKFMQWPALLVAHNMAHPENTVRAVPDKDDSHVYHLQMDNVNEEEAKRLSDNLDKGLRLLAAVPEHMLASAVQENSVERSR